MRTKEEAQWSPRLHVAMGPQINRRPDDRDRPKSEAESGVEQAQEEKPAREERDAGDQDRQHQSGTDHSVRSVYVHSRIL